MIGLRYFLVSVLCFATHVAIMTMADRAAIALPLAILLSFTTVVLVGYALHTRLTFAVRHSRSAFTSYFVAMAAMLPLSAALLWLFARSFGWPMPLAAPAGAAATIAINFVLARATLVARPRPRNNT